MNLDLFFSLPEIPPDTAATNPFLRTHKQGLPQWGEAGEREAYFGLGKAVLVFESQVLQIEEACRAGETDFDKIFGVLEEAKVQLEAVWNSVNLMNMATDRLNTERYDVLNRRVERGRLSVYGSDDIYSALVAIKAEHEEKKHLDADRLRILERYLMEFKRQGAELNKKKKRDLQFNWMKKLLGEQRDYNFRYRLVTERFRSNIKDPNVVRDFPLDVLKAMALDK